MKLKYLPIEDRHNIKKLKHSKNPDEIPEILNSIFERKYTLQVLWEYKKWFYQLREEDLEKYPALKYGLVQMKIQEGYLDEAKELLKTFNEDDYYYLFASITMPGISTEEYKSIAYKARDLNYGHIPNMTLTAGRPSIMAGIWDLSEFSESLIEDPHCMDEIFDILFEEKSEEVAQVLMAEILYQRDECYEALVRIVGLIPFLKDRQDMKLLFVALTLQIYIMVLNNQVATSEPLMEILRQQISRVGLEEYIPNIDALEAWASMYDGDYKKVTKWLRDKAPDEYARFCMLDLFRYMIKMRVYIIQGKYLAVTALASRILPLLEQGKRYMDLCELHMIWAMRDYARGDRKAALEHIEVSLELSEKYRYDRMIADEGLRVFELIKLYIQEKGSTAYAERLLKLSKKIALSHPHYLKSQLPEKPALTDAEMNVLRLLEAGYTNAQIAEVTDTTIDNAKFHCKKIFSKLEVSNRYQAVRKAIELGILEPIEI